MMNPPMANDRALREGAVIERFLESPDEESFADLFRRLYAPTGRFLPLARLRARLERGPHSGGNADGLSKSCADSRSIAFSCLAIQDCAQCPLQAVREAVA